MNFHNAHRTLVVFLAMAIAVALGFTTPAFAGDPTGVALAGVADPTQLMLTLPSCVKQLVELGVSPDKSLKSCEKRFSRESERSEQVAKEARKASEEKGGYGGYYPSYGYTTHGIATYSRGGSSRVITTGRRQATAPLYSGEVATYRRNPN